MNCRDCRYCTHRPATEHGMKASVAMCGLIHLSCDYARQPFETVVMNLPMLDPSRWCGPEGNRFEARA